MPNIIFDDINVGDEVTVKMRVVDKGVNLAFITACRDGYLDRHALSLKEIVGHTPAAIKIGGYRNKQGHSYRTQVRSDRNARRTPLAA